MCKDPTIDTSVGRLKELLACCTPHNGLETSAVYTQSSSGAGTWQSNWSSISLPVIDALTAHLCGGWKKKGCPKTSLPSSIAGRRSGAAAVLRQLRSLRLQREREQGRNSHTEAPVCGEEPGSLGRLEDGRRATLEGRQESGVGKGDATTTNHACGSSVRPTTKSRTPFQRRRSPLARGMKRGRAAFHLAHWSLESPASSASLFDTLSDSSTSSKHQPSQRRKPTRRRLRRLRHIQCGSRDSQGGFTQGRALERGKQKEAGSSTPIGGDEGSEGAQGQDGGGDSSSSSSGGDDGSSSSSSGGSKFSLDSTSDDSSMTWLKGSQSGAIASVPLEVSPGAGREPSGTDSEEPLVVIRQRLRKRKLPKA
jgi:hypothetical protein